MTFYMLYLKLQNSKCGVFIGGKKKKKRKKRKRKLNLQAKAEGVKILGVRNIFSPMNCNSIFAVLQLQV